MRSHLRTVVRRSERPPGNATLRTLTVLIPRSYNPDEKGVLRQVELSKLVITFREMRRLFAGYSVHPAEGWYRDPESGKGIRDRHFRLEVDLVITSSVAKTLRKWKNILELRFDQRAIYMRLSERAFWL
jgi:hypothetical protein